MCSTHGRFAHQHRHLPFHGDGGSSRLREEEPSAISEARSGHTEILMTPPTFVTDTHSRPWAAPLAVRSRRLRPRRRRPYLLSAPYRRGEQELDEPGRESSDANVPAR